MRPSVALTGLMAGALATASALAGDSAVDQLKAYTESPPPAGKTYSVPAGPPGIVGIRLGMPMRDAFTVLQGAYPARGIDTAATQLPTIEKPVLNGFAVGLSPVRSADEWITVEVTPPPSPQVVWRVRRYLGRQKIFRGNVIDSLREKYGKETAELLGESVADDQHASALYWFYDDRWHAAKPPAQNMLFTLNECSGRFANASWFAPNNIVRDSEQIGAADWCNTAGVVLVASFGTEDIVTGLTVEMYGMPFAARSAKTEIAWLAEINKHEQERELRESRQGKPRL